MIKKFRVCSYTALLLCGLVSNSVFAFPFELANETNQGVCIIVSQKGGGNIPEEFATPLDANSDTLAGLGNLTHHVSIKVCQPVIKSASNTSPICSMQMKCSTGHQIEADVISAKKLGPVTITELGKPSTGVVLEPSGSFINLRVMNK